MLCSGHALTRGHGGGGGGGGERVGDIQISNP